MPDPVYQRLAQVLDTLPSGFPPTEDGVELRILQKIFTPEEAELFCELRMTLETAEQIAERTGRPLEGLDERLDAMWKRGQVFGVDFGGVKAYKMMPWVFGIYEFQVERLDRDLAELCEAYKATFGNPFFSSSPQLMQVIPVEDDIPARQEAMPYEKVSDIVERGQSFAVSACVCRKEKHLLDAGCEKPVESCLGIAPVPDVFDHAPWGRAISKDEARVLLARAEEEALVHMAWNTQTDPFFICNCCGCCCGVLTSINERGLPAKEVVNAHYHAEIDAEACSGCGICADERCQTHAIAGEDAEVRSVLRDRCIGCGLCVNTCPTGAIRLVRNGPHDRTTPPLDQDAWHAARARNRGVDFSRYE